MATTVDRGDGRPAVTGSGRREDEETARRLIASWLAEAVEDVEDVPGRAAAPYGWQVPAAAARDVVAVARRLAVQGLAGRPWPVPTAAHLLLARALVTDEHPSAAAWTERERTELAGWVAVLVQRFGEDGVQRLTAALAARR
ncbi:hypothetical protein ACFV4G_11015 [Kitasatospora sp. NPDC059747]|uniref:hypothetical protein n=1 Tax=Kitasatospora sp. NPDC059747 TaxID=3346930 RepID=UPI00366A5060